MVKIFKSLDTNFIYIGTVSSSVTEDFEYTRNGDLFNINRKNTTIPEAVRLNYTQVEGKDLQGNPITFDTPQDLENYLIDIFTQTINVSSFPKPIINSVDKQKINQGETKRITATGSYFTEGSSVSVGNLVVSNIVVNNSSSISFDVTGGVVDDFYDLSVQNISGITVLEDAIEVSLSVWTDLRLGGDSLTIGNGAGNDIRHRVGMIANRDANGLFFTGNLNPWQSWFKVESLQWTRGQQLTCQWIFTTPTANMMIGIGSTATNESSTSQFSQAEVQTYFNTGTNQWGLYGNNGNIGSAGNQNFNTAVAANRVYKIVFENDGSAGGQYSLYEIPSTDSSDWDDTSNLLVTRVIGGTLNPDEQNIMPFAIPRSGDSQRFVAVKVQ